MKLGERIVSNSTFLFLDWIVVTFFSLLYWFSIGKTLLPSDYGIVAVSINTAIIVSTISIFGLQITVPKLLSEYAAKNQFKKIKSLIAFSIKVITISNIIFASVFLLFSNQLSSLLNIPTQAVQLVALILLPFAFWTLSNSILQGFQNMRKIFETDTVGFGAKVILALIFILLGFKFLAPLFAMIISLIIIIFLRSSFLYFRSSHHLNKKFVILNYAVPAFIAGTIWQFFANTPNIILNLLQGPAITGIFAVTLTITSPIAVVPSVLSTALFPIVSALATIRNPKQKQSRLISLVIRYATFLSLPVIVIIVPLSREVILFFSQPKYIPAIQLFPIIASAAFILGLGTILSSSIYAIRKPKVSQNITLLVTATFLTASFPLTIFFSAFGMAFAYFLASLILLFSSYYFLRKFISLKLPIKSIIKIIFASSLLFLIIYSTVALNFQFVYKILTVIAGSLIYLLFLIPLRYYSYEDVRIIQIIANRVPIFRKQLLFLSKVLSKYV